MLNGFDGLRHDTVVCSNHKDSNVSDLGSAGSHVRKSGVTGSIEESDGSFRKVNLVGTDVLGDAAKFLSGDVGFSNVVEKGSLTVVDVTHDCDDRWSENLFARFWSGSFRLYLWCRDC